MVMETSQHTQKNLRRALRRVLSSAAMADPSDPAANETLLKSLEGLTTQLKALDGVDEADADDFTEDITDVLNNAQSLSPDQLAQFLHGLGHLADGSAAPDGSLEDLAGWLETQFGPILSRRFGLEAQAAQKQQIRDAIKVQVDAGLAARGITPPSSVTTTRSVTMKRHMLFWQNFQAIAPGLAPILSQPDGTQLAATQISALLASLDLPNEVTVSRDAGEASLDFTPSDDVETAKMIVQILTDAPDIPGWRIATGGYAP